MCWKDAEHAKMFLERARNLNLQESNAMETERLRAQKAAFSQQVDPQRLSEEVRAVGRIR